MKDELAEIHTRYARRITVPVDRYACFKPEVMAMVQERQRVLARVLTRMGYYSLKGLDIIEVGCGQGANLLEFLRLGAEPERLMGNELQQDRLEYARRALPNSVRLLLGDASQLDIAAESLDLVYQSTVFTSILDRELQQKLAFSMWHWVKPGGAIIWYDFVYNNPKNPDVRGVTLKQIRELFPDAKFQYWRVTLAPPLARMVCRIHPSFYHLFNLFPFLRTHVLCRISKS